jgi:hypothetical protein
MWSSCSDFVAKYLYAAPEAATPPVAKIVATKLMAISILVCSVAGQSFCVHLAAIGLLPLPRDEAVRGTTIYESIAA